MMKKMLFGGLSSCVTVCHCAIMLPAVNLNYYYFLLVSSSRAIEKKKKKINAVFILLNLQYNQSIQYNVTDEGI